MDDNGMIEVRVKPERRVFFNEDDYYAIYACNVHPDDEQKVVLNRHENISIKGYFPILEMKTEYLATIKKDTNDKYQGSYILESIKQERPITVKEQRQFLETILTSSQVDNIYNTYNEEQDIIGLIENGQFDFESVKGLGEKTYEKLKVKVLNNVDSSEVFVFLSKFGIKPNMISKLIKEYKSPRIVIDKIQDNPYLLTEVKGIGFVKADKIAKAVGYDMESLHRIHSCIKFIIEQENQNGHSWIIYKKLLNKVIELLGVKKNIIENAFEEGITGIKCVKDRYTTEKVYGAEDYVASRLTHFKKKTNKIFKTEEIDDFLDTYCKEHEVELEENQRKFFHDWNENSVLMLVGGGGMGKSWLQKILLELINKKKMEKTLLAPTGRASKVMAGYTGEHALTIHRKVGVFEKDSDGVKEIDEQVIIIDESSMCDIFILAKFFKSVKHKEARILFVGDDFQLPSVGVGNFLYDVLNSNKVKISRLKKVFRQAKGGILNVATDIREGKKFLNYTDEGRMVFGNDCVFWLVDSDFIFDGIISNYKKVIQKFNQEDVVILTPTNKGKLGTVALNKEIQKIANPPSATKKEKSFGAKDYETIYRVGDSVMNLVNTYDVDTVDGGTAEIFNGDTGKIVDINEEGKVFIVDMEGILVKISFSDISSLTHSWVTTIHKSQGSQYDIVILVADQSMTYQLNANLLYTGASRAKKYQLVLTQAKTINNAMSRFANMSRRSFLQELLDEYNVA